jgi:FMN-dependent NADH-azoreductase
MPNTEIVRRDLDPEPMPHLDSMVLASGRPDIAPSAGRVS